MPMANEEVLVSLTTICQGKLEEAFQRLYPTIIASMQEGDKAGLTINLDFKRMKDAGTMFDVTYKITPKFPAQSKSSLCQVTSDCKLVTDAPAPKAEVVGLFDKKEAK